MSAAVMHDLELARAAAHPAPAAQPLDDVLGYLRRFVAYPSDHAAVAHALWVVHAHLMDAWESTPRIAFLSPEPGSGKSRALEASELLVPRPVNAVNVSVAYLFRKVGDEEGRPTVLYDEVDTVFTKAGENEDIRGLLNAGHRRHSMVGRCVFYGKRIEPEETPAYCAVALAGLGDLPDTILTRSVIIRMRRRAPSERIEPYRQRDVQAEADRLRERIEQWAGAVANDMRDARPAFPPEISDRDADVWESLLAVADAAGAEWPQRAREAAVALVAAAKQRTPSLGIKLLADLRTVFGDAEKMPTEQVLKKLHAIEEAPWADLRGKELDPRGLALRLRPYGIASKKLRIGADLTLQGYERADLHDAWARYLSPPPAESGTAGTSGTAPGGGVPDVPDVPLSGEGTETATDDPEVFEVAS
jgi:Protein of unknown function (DUF3631)